MLSTTLRLVLVLGRVVALTGAALTIFEVVKWVVEWASAHPLDWNVGFLPLILPAQALLAVWVAWSALEHEGSALFRSAMLAFVVSFVGFYGWYFLLLWDMGPGRMVFGNLAYLASGLIVGLALLLSAAEFRSEHGQTRRQ
jgi:hypothetical protein